MISRELLKKYNVPGPRYTSYPTVPYWDSTPSESEWLRTVDDSLREARRANTGAAIYVHIPFCEKLCTFCGCTKMISQDHSVGMPYVETVLKEWDLYRERLDLEQGFPLAEIHLGGGTPTFLSSDELKRLVEGLTSTCKIVDHHEFSVEANPNVTSREQLEALYEVGFRRLSFGVQDFDEKVQRVINRVQPVEQVRRLTEEARDVGFEGVNYDLVYGLPFQTLDSVTQTVDVVRNLRPDRIAFYAYAHVPWVSKTQRMFTEADLPSGDEKRELYEKGRLMFEELGYREIGMDHFALESDSLWKAVETSTLHRNFMGYTQQEVFPMIGLGMSSIGDSGVAFVQNEKTLDEYRDSVDAGRLPILRGHSLDREDEVLRRHILNLMTRLETDWSREPDYTSWLDEVPGRLKEMEQDGLVQLGEQSCKVSPDGLSVIRNICMAFDARLNRKAPDTELFSKTI